jgi:pimeloyl-ACP methyl ester carboxylesterase
METNKLAVPGASLYYEVRGAGPVLLLICGGVYDAAAFAPLAEALADRYTVVTYDRRGNSRSPLAGPPGPQAVEEHGDDAYRVLTAVGASTHAPAYVFGNSSGAIIGLELAARHPEVVRVLVAHEPPIFELLPERVHWRDVIREVEAAYREGGPAAAGQVLGAALGMSGGQDEERVPGGAPLDPDTAAMLARFAVNNEFFFEFEVPPFARYVPDAAALKAGRTRVVPAAGAVSEGEPPARAAYAVGGLLGVPVATFPGDHGGFGLEVEAFARALHDALTAG